MKIAVIGSGISGLYSAWYLSQEHEVTVFEAGNKPGGHADTHDLLIDNTAVAVDSGFIVFNQQNYPLFSRLLKTLGVEAYPSDMSFSVQNLDTGLEYNATSLNQLFCQRRNIFRPAFYRMIGDIKRFYKTAQGCIDTMSEEITLWDFLKQHQYGNEFIHDHLVPMISALWSAKTEQVYDYPMRFIIQFFHQHNMLQISDRPEWLTIKHGSQTYVNTLIRQGDFSLRLNSPAQRISRQSGKVFITTPTMADECFDKVVFSCHPDQALAALSDATFDERRILGSIRYQDNHITVHSDHSLLPRNRKAWASWNVTTGIEQASPCTMSYFMNSLQNLPVKTPVIVSLNQRPDPEKIWLEREYAHPVFSAETLYGQNRWHEISGHNNSYYCGAYWRWGFHEDGAFSAQRVVDQIRSEHQETAWQEAQAHAG